MPMIVKATTEGSESELNQIAPSSFLTDVLQSNAPDTDAMTVGFYKQIEGEALEFKYEFDEFKYITEVQGEFLVTDETKTTKSIKAGDVVYIQKGTTMKFEAKGGYAKAFYVAKKPLGPPK